MPSFRHGSVLEIARNLKAFLNFEAGVVRGQVPEFASRAELQKMQVMGKRIKDLTKNLGQVQQQLGQTRQQLGQTHQRATLRDRELQEKNKELQERDRENASLRAKLLVGGDDSIAGIRAENIIWMFGSGRTGSSWLSDMMGELEGHYRWNEPYVGEIFGSAYFYRAGDRMRERKDFALGDYYKDAWLHSIRNFVLEGANIRFPEPGDESYLVVKEPNGSMGAPLLAGAFPESRMMLLVRDPRDIIASSLAAHKKGSWGAQWQKGKETSASRADTDPDGFVLQLAHANMETMGKAREAYEAHQGPKVTIRYEDLRYQTLETMKHLYSALKVPLDEAQLTRVVEKHAWENVPAEKKGENKPHRKARPGGWQEDLTQKQVAIVEDIMAPVLDEFYPGWSAVTEIATPSVSAREQLSSNETKNV